MPKGKPKDMIKLCTNCRVAFTAVNNSQKYCGIPCKRKAYQMSGGVESTERQYELVSGDWGKYFGRLCNRSFRRELLSKHDCVELLNRQNYKCALTGVGLTCVLVKGNICKTNASIDRINPKGEYTKNNVQLVCSAVNKLRVDMEINEFIDWCKKVSNHAVCK
jgi:hypothetical protein